MGGVSRERRTTRRISRVGGRIGAVAATVALISAAMVVAAGPAFASSITSAGPLTRVEISPELNCAVDHAGDTDPEFYGDTACGTLLAVGGTLFGPSDIPAGGAASPLTPYTTVSQSAVTGAGTSGNPYEVVTVVDLAATGLRITETDSYVVGQESYRTDVRVSNTGTRQRVAELYRAGDCYLQNSDNGFGAVDASTGSVACVSDEDGRPGSRIEQWVPLSSGSHYFENYYSTVWGKIGSQQAFPDTCECDVSQDNGAGLSWQITIPAGGSVTRSNLTNFSPLGVVPLTTTKTADAATADAGSTDGYTITVDNTNVVPATLASITDDLPAGFTYVDGSTTGATTSDPSISGQTLTWAGPIDVPASDSVSLHFNVVVASTPGDYFNNAGADGGSFAVVPTGDTAKITVTAPEVALEVTKAFADAQVAPGATDRTFTVDVTNTGTADANNVIVTDTVDPRLTVTDASGTDTADVPGTDWNCDATSGNDVSCTLALLAAGNTGQITVTYDVSAETTPGTIRNVALASSEEVTDPVRGIDTVVVAAPPTTPTSDHATSDHATSDHATSDHATSDHATSDHATSDHATSDHAASDHAASDHAASDRPSVWRSPDRWWFDGRCPGPRPAGDRRSSSCRRGRDARGPSARHAERFVELARSS